VQSVTKALEKVPGVEKAEVSREPGEAIVHGSADSQALIKAVVEEGYQAEVKG
jgi:copper chaperone